MMMESLSTFTRRAALVAVASAVLGSSAVASADEYVLKIATVALESTPWGKALKEYAAAVEKASAGRLKVRLFFSGAYDEEGVVVQAMQRDRINGGGMSTAALASAVPELNVLDLPYLMRTYAEADKVLDNPKVQAAMDKALEAKGFKMLFLSENGFRSFGTKKGFIKTPGDLRGKKMRSQESPPHLAMYRGFGGSPVPIALAEVLTSIQTGVVEGWDNTAFYAYAAKWHTAIKFYSVTEHIFQPAIIAVTTKFVNSLPADLKKILFDSRGDIPKRLRRTLRAANNILINDKFPKANVAVYKLTDAEKAAFEPAAAKTRSTYIAAASASVKSFFDVVASVLGRR